MKFSTYQTLYNKTSSYNTNIITSVIAYIIVYSLLITGIHFWNVHTTMLVYFSLFILTTGLNFYFENLEGKGEKSLLEFFKYTPVNPTEIFFFHYFKRMWLSYQPYLDIIGPCLIFSIYGASSLETGLFFLRFHFSYFIILFFYFFILWLNRNKATKFFLTLTIIVLVTVYYIFNSLQVSHFIKSYFQDFMLIDLFLLFLFFMAICFYHYLIENLLSITKNGTSATWIQYTSVMAKLFALPFHYNKKNYSFILYIVKSQIRNGQLIYSYLFSIVIILITRSIWNNLITKTNTEILSTIALILSISIFNKVKGFRYLEKALNLKYLPISNVKKQFIEDICGFINMMLIWVVLLLDFSLIYHFKTHDIVVFTLVLICYYIVSIGFILPEKQDTHTEKEQKEANKKSLIISIFFVLSQVLINFVVTALLSINITLIILIIPILLLWPYFRIYKNILSFEQCYSLTNVNTHTVKY